MARSCTLLDVAGPLADDDATDELEIAKILLRKDLFAGVRSAAHLETLVSRAVATVPKPYAMILCRLLGYHPMHDEEAARAFFLEVVAHRDDLASRLGRAVHLRVAALDLIALGRAPAGLSGPILIGPLVLQRIVRAAKGR